MVCNIDFITHMNNVTGLPGLLSYPNTCFGYFWVAILLGFWVVLVLTIYFKDKETNLRPEMTSILGVASIPTFVLSIVATRLSMLTNQGMTILFVFCAFWIVLWFLKK